MKKNRQYYKSKKRVMSRHKQNADAVVAAIRIATETMISAIEIQMALAKPIPKYPSGGLCNEPNFKGIYLIPENGPELIFKANETGVYKVGLQKGDKIIRD